MSIKPDSFDLLETARLSLANKVAPNLDGAARYEVLLAISAMGTVSRELADMLSGSSDETTQINRLLQSVGLEAVSDNQSPAHALATAIRAGSFSEGHAISALHDYLRQSCRRTLEATNPKVAASYTASKTSDV